MYDLAAAAVFMLRRVSGPVPSTFVLARTLFIFGLVELTTNIVGYSGKLVLDLSKSDGCQESLGT